MSDLDDGSKYLLWTDPNTSRACKNNQKKVTILRISQNYIGDFTHKDNKAPINC